MNLINWLFSGDISIRYQTERDLLGNDLIEIKNKIGEEGFGKAFLERQNENGHWGRAFYQPKWISTHYTLLDLRNLNINRTDGIEKAINLILEHSIGEDGGINPSVTIKESDVCLCGMALNYMCYFNTDEKKLHSIVDFIITQIMDDGGFNCNYNRSGAKHSSLHSTISVLEGIRSYIQNDYNYRIEELEQIEKLGVEFILMHKLYKSDHTDKVINKSFTMLSYPSRWRYDVLRALDYLRDANVPYDKRMEDALILLISKRKKDGTWPVQNKHPGEVHFDMEKTGSSSRFNTLRALRVLNHYKHEFMLNDVLLKVSTEFNKNKIRYGIGASLLLKAYDIVSEVSDIDILIDYNYVEKAKQILDSLGLKKDFKKNDLYQTDTFLEYNIDGIDLDIMSKFTINTDEGVFIYPFEKEEIKTVNKFNCNDLPLLSLENWFIAYILINRSDKAKLIKDYFTKNGFDRLILEEGLKQQTSKKVRREIEEIL